ncbi:hypothetical protein HETIRDRAFT_101409 [Heterobasidion irregulare TC 32-1]|uniref:Uncharacterized protein n=1 Tax=Heterobasidion irregulare (strain TC 32-1) TaxID=747525 RepID=W4K8F4_HETIT|nr:uncharacterized protein HETIRDRAFT_101409 [Heterobasidion irregulare TC 32-1]ETW82073.1 hypothetical protein HETIRDRAFT_101409 [Heterobasidion irregulare TC 32-1]
MSSNGSLHLSSIENTLIDRSIQTSPSSPSSESSLTPAETYIQSGFVTDRPMMSMRELAWEQEEIARKYQARVDANAAEEAATARTPSPPILSTVDITTSRTTSSSRSPSPFPLIHEGNKGVVFPDRETYLMTPVSYMMGLIEGTLNTEFVSGPTWPEVRRALEILEEERSFVRHAQRALQIREGTLIARINAGERRLMGLNQTTQLCDSFHPADDNPATKYHMPTTAVVSSASSSASNGAPLCPMPGAYPTRHCGWDDVYKFTQISPRYHIKLLGQTTV